MTHALGALVRAVDLVHDEQQAQPVGQRLADDEARLGHHAFDRVDQQQHAVHHPEHALHLGAEVRVAGGIDQMDPHTFDFDRSVLGQDRDAALALEVFAVQHAVGHDLVGAEHARLAQEAVHERRLSVVDVRDDGNVADVLARLEHRGEQGSEPAGRRAGGSSCRSLDAGRFSGRSSTQDAAPRPYARGSAATITSDPTEASA
jgi:hypothetical protein